LPGSTVFFIVFLHLGLLRFHSTQLLLEFFGPIFPLRFAAFEVSDPIIESFDGGLGLQALAFPLIAAFLKKTHQLTSWAFVDPLGSLVHQCPLGPSWISGSLKYHNQQGMSSDLMSALSF
jgi:hypothetical protein